MTVLFLVFLWDKSDNRTLALYRTCNPFERGLAERALRRGRRGSRRDGCPHVRGNGRHCPARDRRSGSGSGRDRGDRGGGGGCRGQRGRRGGREGDGDALQEARGQPALLDVLDTVLQALDVPHLKREPH